jgi:hypothetical protein
VKYLPLFHHFKAIYQFPKLRALTSHFVRLVKKAKLWTTSCLVSIDSAYNAQKIENEHLNGNGQQ